MATKLINTCSLYYDTGTGFNDANKITKVIEIADRGPFTVNVEFDLNDLSENNIVQFRFDPLENLLCKVFSVSVLDENNTPCSSRIVPANSENLASEDFDYFLNTDPQFLVDCKFGTSLKFIYEAELLSQQEISNIFAYKDNQIGLKNNLKNRLKHSKQRDFIPKTNKTDFDIKIKEPSYVNKILFVLHSGENHGPALLFKNFIQVCKNEFNIMPIILCLTNDLMHDELEKFGPVFDLDLSYFDVNLRKNLLGLFLDKVTKIGCNIAICNSLTTGIVTDSLNEYGFKITQLIHELPELVKFNQLTNAANTAFTNSDKFVFPAKYVLDRYKNSDFGIEGDACICSQGVYNTKGIESFAEKSDFKSKLNENIGIAKKDKLVLGCGTGFLVKGIDYFVTVAIELCRKIDDCYFVWIGHFDPGTDQMGQVLGQRQIELAGLSDRIFLLDFVENASDYFAAADVYFLSSRNDTYPSTVLEAAMNFTPTVLFEDAGGAQDLIESGKNGEIIPFGNTSAASEVIYNILKSDKLRKSLSENAKASVQNSSMHEYAKKILDIATNY